MIASVIWKFSSEIFLQYEQFDAQFDEMQCLLFEYFDTSNELNFKSVTMTFQVFFSKFSCDFLPFNDRATT